MCLMLEPQGRRFGSQVSRDGGEGGQTLGVGTLLGVAAPLLQQAIVAGRRS